MLRFLATVSLTLVIVGGIWALMNRNRIEDPTDVVDLVRERLSAFQVASGDQADAAAVSYASDQPTPNPGSTLPVIRIASFQLRGCDTTARDPGQQQLLTDIFRQYDVIALQGIGGSADAWLAWLMGSLNAAVQGADYGFIDDRDSGIVRRERSAIVFNRATIELDQLNWYTVNDPDDLLKREPLVGWFRTRISERDRAFTFTLANVELSVGRPFSVDGAGMELAYLDELFRAIRNDGRGEDDVIIAGDFNAGDHGLTPIRQRAGLTWVVSNAPTDVRNTAQFDNLLFDGRATIEFTGQGGVFDFMRRFNLRLEEAESLSKRLPVWAEFTALEGVGIRRVAEENFRQQRSK